MKNNRHNVFNLLLISMLLLASAVIADETEIYFAAESGDVAPNVLFLIDASGSMTREVSSDTQVPKRTRMQVLKDSFREVMANAPANLNVGLMHYANHGLGNDYWWSSIKGVNFPATLVDTNVQPLIAAYQDDDNLPNPATGNTSVRDFLTSIVNDWDADGYTPIVDSLYEAARYFRGDAVAWGSDLPSLGWAAHPLTYDGSISCTASHTEQCFNSWGQCNSNIVSGSCSTADYNVCCNWVETGSDGSGYCENNNYSCTTSIETCKHTICDTYDTTATLTYKSPIEYSCQANYLVLMSDGKPEYPYYPGAGETDGTLYYPPSSKRYPGGAGYAADKSSESKAGQAIEDYLGLTCADSPQGYASGTCGPEITHWLATVDQHSQLEGDQYVQTYAVAFAMADEPTGTAYMQSLVSEDGGFFTANNAEELAGAFSAILNTIEESSSSFSSPTYSVDRSSLLSHSDEIYMPMFDRKRNVLWSGNLKKFKREEVTLEDGTVASRIVDRNGNPAVNDQGQLSDTAFDLWGDAASGREVAAGGAASQLPLPDARKLYTDVVGSVLSTLDVNNPALQLNVLYQDIDGNKGHGDNLSGCDPNNPAADKIDSCIALKAQLIDFIRGKDADGNPRQHMGDMLNSKPVVVDYGTEKRILVGTNEGFLHSIDTETGVEQWAFMPKSLIPNQRLFYENNSSDKHVYGVDGPLTLWDYDANKDGKIKAADGDKRVLFFGLRRGGSAYYALDITNPDTPLILWKKENLPNDPLWKELGETWSKLTLAKMRVGSSTDSKLIDVVVFGAGYDDLKDEEDVTRRQDDLRGRDVIILDALTGGVEFEWSLRRDVSGADSQLQHSIPGDIRVLDMDRNGALDRLYFSDTGGNVWRVDMDHDLRDNDTDMYNYDDAILTKIAALGTGDEGTDHRKFFYEPDIATMQHNGKVLMTISLGSGYRTHPLNMNTNDRFYVLMEPNVFNEPPDDFMPITNAALTDAANLTELDNLLNGNHVGWYHNLNYGGEKVLATSMTFLNKVIFTTFSPVDEDGDPGNPDDPCEVPPNSARAYILNLFTGQAVANLDRSTDDSREEYFVAGANEILDSPQVVFRAPTASDGTACKEGDCQQTVEIRVGKLAMPLMDDSNSDNDVAGNEVGDITGKTDLSDILPRVFWLDHDVSRGY